MKANSETLKQKLEIIAENKDYLKEKKTGFDAESAGYEELQAVKHSMFEIAESSIDIASHIVASEGLERPDNYSGLFPVLARNDIISDELGERLADMARFRNLLVHRYGEIENSRLEEFISEDMRDIDDFTSAIYRYMEK